MYITIFIGGLYGGGAERVACNLANYLSRNHIVTMLTMSDTKNRYDLSKDVKHKALINEKERKKKVIGNLLRFFRLRGYVKKERCDAYVVMLPITTMMLLHFKRIGKAPIIVSERNDPSSYSFIKKELLKYYSPRADAWIFQTEDAMNWYGQTVKNGVVIPNAINPTFIRKSYKGKRDKTIVAVGRLTKQKNFSLLINAFCQISDICPDYKLVIYGKGPLEARLRNEVTRKGLTNKVEFPGHIDNMPEVLERATLFVLSSDYEGMPNALIEAMALGLPCISTDCPCGGPRYLIENGVNGILVPVGNTEKLALEMSRLIQHPNISRLIGLSAKKGNSKLNYEEVYNTWERFILSISQMAN